jgi:hypothetical protein
MVHSLPEPATCEVLTARKRRQLLTELAKTDPEERPFDPIDLLDEPTPEEPTEMELLLYHVHLPKLGEQKLIRWDRTTLLIERGPNWDDVTPFLQGVKSSSEDTTRSQSIPVDENRGE